MANLVESGLIFVTGHAGMVGSAIVRRLRSLGYANLLMASRRDLDLRDAVAVDSFFNKHRPAIVVHAAARVGGIQANTAAPAEFLRDNILTNTNVIHAAAMHGTRRFCFLGSSCIYPRECSQPMKESALLTGPLEPTNEGYAIAKIAGLRYAQYCQQQYGLNSFSVMPCNLYGTNDHFDLEKSHVLTALVKKFCDAVENETDLVTVWGTGAARREFLHVDDAAEGIVMLIESYPENDFINLGSGYDITIRDLTELIAKQTGYAGQVKWDSSKPDGMPRKCLDLSKIATLGFMPRVSLEEGVSRTIIEYREMRNYSK